MPLLTLETWWPVTDVHVLGVTLQHELSYTNLLELLDLSGITLRACERAEDEPLVVAGGPATANFLPVAPFLDAVVVGDGEEVFPELLETLRAGERRGSDPERSGWTRSPGSPGVFVPGVSASVERQAVARLEGAPYPRRLPGPADRGGARPGLGRGHAWVQPGLPLLPGGHVVSPGARTFARPGPWASALGELAATGHEEVSLASLSTTDYTGLYELLEGLAAAAPGGAGQPAVAAGRQRRRAPGPPDLSRPAAR